jgi:hypothetical protein
VVTLFTWLIRPGYRFIAVSGDKDDGIAVMDGRERAVLELAGPPGARRSDAFAVGRRAADLLQLQGRFEGDAILWNRGDAVPQMVRDGTG